MFASPDPEALRDVEANPNYSPSTLVRPVNSEYQQAPSTGTEKQQSTKPEGGGDSPSGTNVGGTASGEQSGVVSRVALSLNWGAHQLLIAFFAFVVMVASARLCDLEEGSDMLCLGIRGYQVAVGATSLIIGLIAGIAYFAGMDNQIALEVISIFQLLWWIAGVIVLTYYGDYQTTHNANGYYGGWAALIFSILAVVCVSETFDYGMSKPQSSVRKPLFYLFFASLIVMLSSIGPCSPQSDCSSFNAYAVCLGSISMFISLVLFFFARMFEKRLMTIFGSVLVLWWLIGTLIVTFGDPFTAAGNGYFASYAALFSSIGVVHVLNRDR